MQEVQHIFRKYTKGEYESVAAGTRAFDICLETDDVQMQVGDLITFQELDEEGNPTGNEITKKVSHRVTKKGPDSDVNLVVLGFVPTEMQTLRSIYNYGYTMDVVIDKEEDEINYLIHDGPNYSPIISSPEFLDGGILENLNIEKWPKGRYSVTLMVRLDEEKIEEGKPIPIYIADALILLVVADPTEDQIYQGYIFEELDTRALLDGNTISLEGENLEPMLPSEMDDIAVEQMQQEEGEEEEVVQKLMDELHQQADRMATTGNPEIAAVAREFGLDEEPS